MEPTELNEKPKFNWKRLLITIGIVIITAGAIGGSIYYVMNQQAQKDKESAEKTAQDLQKQIDDLKKTETTSTTTPTTTTTTDPTASWKTLTSTQGFTVKYPSNWAHNAKPSASETLSSGNEWISFMVYDNSTTPAIPKTPKEFVQFTFNTPAPKNIQTTTVSGYDAVKYQQTNAADNTTYYSYAIRKGDKILVFSYGASDKNPAQDTITVAEQMVKTITIN